MILIEKKNSSEDIIFFLFLPEYPHILLKDETSSVQDLWLPLPINMFYKD